MFSGLSPSSEVAVPWNKKKYFRSSLQFLGMKIYFRGSSMFKKKRLGKNYVNDCKINKYTFSKFKYFREQFLITILSTTGP
jgi:hypothetical protein